MKCPRTQRRILWGLLSVSLVSAGLFIALSGRAPSGAASGRDLHPAEAAARSQPGVTPENPPPAPVAVGVSNYAGFQLRPLPVTRENSNFQWTAEDAMDTNVIRQLAHNDREYQRMVEENRRIQRRQLVYIRNTMASVIEQSRASGEPVKQLPLPGFDGQELPFAVERADVAFSKQSGTLTGRLANRPDSLVTLAFQFGREAFTVISPADGIYLQAFPREPGQLILTSFDPGTYLALPEGEPIKTTNTFKIAQ
jgi:hypothetical protein